MLKLYTDTSFINETYRKQLFPLLFDICILKNKNLNDYYELVNNAKEADVLVMPIHYDAFIKHQQAFKHFKNTAETYNKKVWVYTAGDFGYSLNNNHYNFRLSGFKSKLSQKDFILPSFVNDPYHKLNTNFFTLQKTNLPHIGFVGHAKLGFKKWLKELIIHIKTKTRIVLKNEKSDLQAFYPSGYKRAQFLNRIQQYESIITNFVFRNQYRAGIKTEAQKQQTTREFYENMSQNPYTFCIRGAGNFSVRFYETLAMGRIPVLIDTDCKLPLEQDIDWNKHAFIINESDMNSFENQLTKFHEELSESDFIKLQENNRKLWETKLERMAYFKAIHNIFVNNESV